MKNVKQLVCPISNERISERVTRINALTGIVLMVSGFAFNSILFFVFLMADFYIRAFTKSRFSPISYLSHRMVNAFNMDKKRVDKAPKVFAARLGFLMTFTTTLLFALQMHSAALAVGGILVFFASLEFALALCMGCLMYTYLIVPFLFNK